MEIVVPEEFRDLFVQDENRPVVKYPNPILRQRAREVVKFTKKTRALIDQMIRVMKQANGQGLAAPQVGVSERVIIIAPGGSKPIPLVNPILVEAMGKQVKQEGCLSIPGLYGDVERARRVVVRALDRNGKAVEYEMEGMPAVVVQHEIDHLEGVLFTDRVDPATLEWIRPDQPEDE